MLSSPASMAYSTLTVKNDENDAFRNGPSTNGRSTTATTTAEDRQEQQQQEHQLHDSISLKEEITAQMLPISDPGTTSAAPKSGALEIDHADLATMSNALGGLPSSLDGDHDGFESNTVASSTITTTTNDNNTDNSITTAQGSSSFGRVETETTVTIVPSHHGQPTAVSAWPLLAAPPPPLPLPTLSSNDDESDSTLCPDCKYVSCRCPTQQSGSDDKATTTTTTITTTTSSSSSSSNNNKKKFKRWTTNVDAMLKALVELHGTQDWSLIASQMPGGHFTGSQCRKRWLVPKKQRSRNNFTKDEDRVILQLRCIDGLKWTEVANELPGRTSDQVRSHWHTTMARNFEAYLCKQHGVNNPNGIRETRKDQYDIADDLENVLKAVRSNSRRSSGTTSLTSTLTSTATTTRTSSSDAPPTVPPSNEPTHRENVDRPNQPTLPRRTDYEQNKVGGTNPFSPKINDENATGVACGVNSDPSKAGDADATPEHTCRRNEAIRTIANQGVQFTSPSKQGVGAYTEALHTDSVNVGGGTASKKRDIPAGKGDAGTTDCKKQDPIKSTGASPSITLDVDYILEEPELRKHFARQEKMAKVTSGVFPKAFDFVVGTKIDRLTPELAAVYSGNVFVDRLCKEAAEKYIENVPSKKRSVLEQFPYVHAIQSAFVAQDGLVLRRKVLPDHRVAYKVASLPNFGLRFKQVLLEVAREKESIITIRNGDVVSFPLGRYSQKSKDWWGNIEFTRLCEQAAQKCMAGDGDRPIHFVDHIRRKVHDWGGRFLMAAVLTTEDRHASRDLPSGVRYFLQTELQVKRKINQLIHRSIPKMQQGDNDGSKRKGNPNVLVSKKRKPQLPAAPLVTKRRKQDKHQTASSMQTTMLKLPAATSSGRQRKTPAKLLDLTTFGAAERASASTPQSFAGEGDPPLTVSRFDNVIRQIIAAGEKDGSIYNWKTQKLIDDSPFSEAFAEEYGRRIFSDGTFRSRFRSLWFRLKCEYRDRKGMVAKDGNGTNPDGTTGTNDAVEVVETMEPTEPVDVCDDSTFALYKHMDYGRAAELLQNLRNKFDWHSNQDADKQWMEADDDETGYESEESLIF